MAQPRLSPYRQRDVSASRRRVMATPSDNIGAPCIESTTVLLAVSITERLPEI